jgi:lipopolysaccharide transport system ATP-binding protein
LESLYEASQGEIQIDKKSNSSIADEYHIDTDYRDVREALINSSTLRNDIEIFKFDPENAGFGTGSAVISSVVLKDSGGVPLSWVIGGEVVILEIRCKTHQPMSRPIVGFQFKDRLGQIIFADNSYLTYCFESPAVDEGQELIARFEFHLPILPSGDYTLSVALAEGTQENHVQHHWMHDALSVKVHSSSVCFGLIGVPMKKITMAVQ